MGQRQICILTLGEGGLMVLVKGLSPFKGAPSSHFPLCIIYGATTDAQLVDE